MAININPGSPLRHVASFTSSGTYKVPEGTTIVFASVRGSSGGGGQGAGDTNRYGGQAGRAGGAGVITSGFVQVTPGRDHTVTIGAGGGNSATGGTSTFDGGITVTGGAGGSQASVGATGSGSAITSLTTVPPSATSLSRVFGNTTQSTGGTTGGAGGGTTPWGAGAGGAGGQSGSIEIYI